MAHFQHFEKEARLLLKYYIWKSFARRNGIGWDFVNWMRCNLLWMRCKLCHLHDMKQLNLPVPLMKKLFLHAKSHFRLPDWDGKTVSKNMDLSKFDRSYNSQFVVWYQNTKRIFNSLQYLVAKYFISYGKMVNMCLKWMKFETEKGNYIRKYLCQRQSLCHEKHNTVVKVTSPSKNIVLLFGQPEKVVISISLPN